MEYKKDLDKLITELSYLPSIGPKSAERLAMHILSTPKNRVEELANTILSVRQNIQNCQICNNYSNSEICDICSDPKRNDNQIIVVSNAMDLLSIERTSSFKGKYHILGGTLNPLRGVTIERLNIDSIFKRVKNGNINEIIFALSSSVENDATINYIKDRLPDTLITTKLGRGIPMGGQIEYLDSSTLISSLNNRTQI